MSKSNGKSLAFVRKIIQSGRCNGMENNDFKTMGETNFLSVTEKVLKINKECVKFENNTYELEVPSVKDNGEEYKIRVSVEYNPNAEFQYFTTEQCICDGTFSFYISLMTDIINTLFSHGTCYELSISQDVIENLEKYDIHYTVGDFVVGTEYGKRFATKEKPWLLSRFTVMLPIRCEFVEKELDRK